MTRLSPLPRKCLIDYEITWSRENQSMQGAKLSETLKNYCANGKRDYNRLTLFLDHCCRLHHVRTMNFILQRNMIEQILKRLRTLGFFIESISTELSTSDVLDNCKKINAFIQFPLDISSHKIFFSRFDFSLFAGSPRMFLEENHSGVAECLN